MAALSKANLLASLIMSSHTAEAEIQTEIIAITAMMTSDRYFLRTKEISISAISIFC